MANMPSDPYATIASSLAQAAVVAANAAALPTAQPQPAATTQPVAPPQTLVRCPDGSLVAPGQPCAQTQSATSWAPWIVGAVAVAAGVGVAWYIAKQKSRPRVPTREPCEPCPCLATEEEER